VAFRMISATSMLHPSRATPNQSRRAILVVLLTISSSVLCADDASSKLSAFHVTFGARPGGWRSPGSSGAAQGRLPVYRHL